VFARVFLIGRVYKGLSRKFSTGSRNWLDLCIRISVDKTEREACCHGVQFPVSRYQHKFERSAARMELRAYLESCEEIVRGMGTGERNADFSSAAWIRHSAAWIRF